MTPLYAEWRPIKPKASTPCIHADRLSDRACSINAQADALIRKFSEMSIAAQESERLAEGLQYTVQLLLDDIRELRKKIHDEACNSAAKLSNPKKRR